MASKQQRAAGRRVRLFKNGRSQAVRIPREWEFPGNEAVIRKKGRQLILEPAKTKPTVQRKSLLEILDSLEPLGPKDRFPDIEDSPPEPVDL